MAGIAAVVALLVYAGYSLAQSKTGFESWTEAYNKWAANIHATIPRIAGDIIAAAGMVAAGWFQMLSDAETAFDKIKAGFATLGTLGANIPVNFTVNPPTIPVFADINIAINFPWNYPTLPVFPNINIPLDFPWTYPTLPSFSPIHIPIVFDIPNIPTFPSAGIPHFQTGTPYVPETMLAVIHEGEAVIPAEGNPYAHPTQLGSSPSRGQTVRNNERQSIHRGRSDSLPSGGEADRERDPNPLLILNTNRLPCTI